MVCKACYPSLFPKNSDFPEVQGHIKSDMPGFESHRYIVQYNGVDVSAYCIEAIPGPQGKVVVLYHGEDGLTRICGCQQNPAVEIKTGSVTVMYRK